MRLRRALITATLGAALMLGACGDGEDRPGQVTSENGGSGSASASGSGSGSGTGTGSATGDASGEVSASGPHGHEEEAEPAFPLKDASQTVKVGLVDYAFVDVPATITGPKVVFEATNKGPSEHEIEVLDSADKALGEVHIEEVGGTKSLAIELEPGTYTLQCLVETPKGKTHAELGMKQTFTVS